MSTIFAETNIDKTNKAHQKVTLIGSKFVFKMSTIYRNACAQMTMPLRNHCRNDGMIQQPLLLQRTFLQLLYIMDQ